MRVSRHFDKQGRLWIPRYESAEQKNFAKRMASLHGLQFGTGITQVEFVKGFFPNTASGTIQLNFGTPTLAGELIVISGLVVNGFNVATPVVDSGSQSYSNAFVTANMGATGWGGGIWYFANSASGITSVTCKETASSGTGIAWAAHYTGAATSNALGNFSTYSGPTVSPWSSAAIVGGKGSLLWGVCFGKFNGGNSVMSVSGNWNLNDQEQSSSSFDGNNGNGGLASYQVLTAAIGSIQNTGTDTGTVNHYSAVAEFKSPAVSGHFQLEGGTGNISTEAAGDFELEQGP